MRLRSKLVVVLLVLAVVLGASLYGGLELYKQQVTESETDRAAETATVVAAQIDATVQEKRDLVAFAASRPEAASFGRANHFAADLVNSSRFYAVQVVAVNGTVMAFTGDVTEASRERTVGSEIGSRPYVREALTGRVHVSEPEQTSAGEYLTVISAPIVENGDVVGVLAAAMYIDTSTLLTPVQPLPSDRRAVVVVARNRTLYAAGPSFRESISATATVESTGWTVRITRDQAALEALLHEATVVQTIGVAFVLLVVGLVGGWQYRTMVVQLDRLQCAFDAAGRGEYGYSISLSGGDEWGDIETGFDDLLDDLAGRERVLERRRQRLEVLNRVLRHNLRTDVNVILGYADLLRDDPDDPRSLAGVIHGRAESLSELGEIARETQALMSDSASTPEPIDVGAELAKIVDELRAEFAGTRVELDAPPSVYVAAVPEITAALEHVCENACEHNDAETPRVDVSIAPIGDDRVRLTVADNGPGIPSHELDVLERGRETQLDHGSGLGLWLVKWAVDGSGGDLAFEPNEPRGTVVTIDLDAAAEGD